MIRHPFPSVHNREHGFSKRFNPAGVHNFIHTWRPSPLATWCPSFGALAEWWSPTTFTSRRPTPWATPKGLSPQSDDGRTPTRNRSLCVEVALSRTLTPVNPGHVYVCTALKTFYAYVEWNAQSSSWRSLSELVSRRESHTSTRGCTLIMDQETITWGLGRQGWVCKTSPRYSIQA